VTLSAVVPATDRPATLSRIVAAIRSAEDAPDELIVVEEADSPGPAAARNEGARRSTGDVIVFADADLVPHTDAFRRIRRAFEDDPGLTALFGAYDDEPEARGTVARFRNLLHHHVHASSPGPAETFWAGLGAVRREPFLAAGGFDERFTSASVEDIELGMRLRASGGRIRLDPSVRGTHLKDWTLTGMLETDLMRRGVPWVELLIERGGSTALNLGWRHRLSALASLAGAVAVARRRPAAAAVSAAALVALNGPFYALLVRKGGTRLAAAGVGLHVLHHLAGAASVPLGAARYLARRS
jgi:GT2 family glycosyltransferase